MKYLKIYLYNTCCALCDTVCVGWTCGNCHVLVVWNGRGLEELTIAGSIEVQSAIGPKLFHPPFWCNAWWWNCCCCCWLLISHQSLSVYTASPAHLLIPILNINEISNISHKNNINYSIIIILNKFNYNIKKYLVNSKGDFHLEDRHFVVVVVLL